MKDTTRKISLVGGLCSFFVVTLCLFGDSHAPAFLEIGTRKQVFVDSHVIQSLTDARQVLNVAVKEPSNPVVKPDRPWEGPLLSVSFVTTTKTKRFSRCGTAPVDNGEPSAAGR